MLLHIRWVQAKEAEAEADSALNQATVVVAEKAQAQMEAAKAQAIASLKLPELREGEARAAAALQRLQIAKTQLEEDANRILRRRDELTRRLAQLAEDIGREERLVADNAAILARLDAEEADIANPCRFRPLCRGNPRGLRGGGCEACRQRAQLHRL
jgi:chromosome segregation protein